MKCRISTKCYQWLHYLWIWSQQLSRQCVRPSEPLLLSLLSDLLLKPPCFVWKEWVRVLLGYVICGTVLPVFSICECMDKIFDGDWKWKHKILAILIWNILAPRSESDLRLKLQIQYYKIQITSVNFSSRLHGSVYETIIFQYFSCGIGWCVNVFCVCVWI